MQKIKLTQGYEALVDDGDFERLLRFKWHAKVTRRGVVYAATNIRLYNKEKPYRWIAMHTFLLHPSSGFEVDHRDGDGKNNQRYNLRICRHNENIANRRPWRVKSSKYLGVTYNFHLGFWQVCCRKIWVGSFTSEIEAALAYDRAALKIHGEFARPNFPEVA